MAEDRQPGSADQPEDESGPTGGSSGEGGSTPPPTGGSANSGWQLGGAPKKPGGDDPQPANPFEALFSSLGGGAGGDMNALVQQLQSAFSMLGGPAGMFGTGTAAASGSGVNWEVEPRRVGGEHHGRLAAARRAGGHSHRRRDGGRAQLRR
jgi:hypothetical protein